MATALAESIVKWLIATSVVEEGDRELYVYGFFLLITRFFFFLVTVVLGFFLGIPCESVIFYTVFFLLRSYAGGVHARTERACTVWTTFAMSCAVIAIKMVSALNAEVPLIFIFSNLCIYILSPLDSKGKPLNADEKRRYRKICLGILFICDIVVLSANCLKLPKLYIPVICSISLEACLLGVGQVYHK